MRRTSSRRNIGLHSGQNGRCTITFLKFQSQNVQIFGYVYQKRHGPNHVQYGRSSRSSWKESVRSSSGRTLMGKATWESPIETWRTWLGKILNWECIFVKRARGLFLSVFVDDIKVAGKTENIEPTWEISSESRWSGRTNIISWPRIFGMHSKRV